MGLLMGALVGLGCGGGALPQGETAPGRADPRIADREADSREAADVADIPTPVPVYYVYVAAGSEGLLRRVRFQPDEAVVDGTVAAPVSQEWAWGPRGLRPSPDGQFLYVTAGESGHGGGLWKVRSGEQVPVSGPIELGRFPTSMDLTPDGLYAFVANADLRDDSVGTTLSIVYTPDMVEVTRIQTCAAPRGGRMEPGGAFLYSTCARGEQLVEVDTRTFEVARRLSLSPTGAGSAPAADASDADAPAADANDGTTGTAVEEEPACAPTWAQPSADGIHVFVACNAADVVHEISRETWTSTRTFPTGPGPYRLAVSPDGRVLVATLERGGGVEFVDVKTGVSLGREATSVSPPMGVVISPDSRYAFVSAGGADAGSGTVEVFDLETRRRVAAVEVGPGASDIGFWKMDAQASPGQASIRPASGVTPIDDGDVSLTFAEPSR